MAYILFSKTEIASYTDVAALFCVAQENSKASIFWKYQLYGNLCLEYDTKTLYHCGKYDHFSYMEFENEDRIILEKLARNTSYDEIKKYLDNGFFIMLPINTKTLGYTDVAYKHNVFITGYEIDEFIVFDFWTPSFKWKYEKINCNRLCESVDFTNNETVQMIYAFKYNENARGKYIEAPSWEELKNTYTNTWNCSRNQYYDDRRNAYGFSAYYALREHIKSIAKLALVDCQNMHVILDHLRFTQNSLRKLFGDRKTVLDLIAEYDELIRCADRMRTLAYKYYITQKDISKIKDLLVEEISKIREKEKEQFEHIILSNGE